MVAPSPDRSSVRAWRPAIAGIREVFHARFPAHAYPPHTHDTWTLFVVDDGAIRYDLDRRNHVAVASMVTVLPPGVVHDGRPATPDGYAMRVLYVEPEVLGDAAIGPAVDRPVVAIPGLRDDLSRLHAALACRDDALETETRFAIVAEAVRSALLGDRVTTVGAGHRDRDLAEGLRAYLAARISEPVTIAGAATELGTEPTRLARAFTATFGLPPHAWLTSRRLEVARERIVDGAELADVAAEVGFVDQAHLTRRFRQWYGTTPAALRGRRSPAGGPGERSRRSGPGEPSRRGGPGERSPRGSRLSG